MNVRPAAAADLDRVRDLLTAVRLPAADLSLEAGPLLLAEADGTIVACAGVEHHGDVGLLRSVAVAPAFRARGVALRLCCEVMRAAGGLRELYLLTENAAPFFERIGFAAIPRAAAPESIRATREFRALCPDTAILMRRTAADDSAPWVTRFRDAYAAFVGGDPAPLLPLLTAATVYHLPGNHLGGGELRGRDAIVRRLVAAASACESPPVVAVLDAFGDHRVVVTTEHLQARRRDRVLDQRIHVVWRFEQAACTRIWAHFEDQRACDAFWEGWR